MVTDYDFEQATVGSQMCSVDPQGWNQTSAGRTPRNICLALVPLEAEEVRRRLCGHGWWWRSRNTGTAQGPCKQQEKARPVDSFFNLRGLAKHHRGRGRGIGGSFQRNLSKRQACESPQSAKAIQETARSESPRLERMGGDLVIGERAVSPGSRAGGMY